MFDIGSIPWFIAVVGGTILLGLGLAFGIAQWRRRDRRLDPLREQVTRQNYAAEERREQGRDPTPDPSVTRKSSGA